MGWHEKQSRRTVVKNGAGIGAMTLVAGCLGGGGGSRNTWTHATGGDGGTNQVQGSALSVFFEEESDQLGISPQATQGTVHNARLLDSEQADIGHVHSNVLYDSYNETGPFEEEPIDTKPLQGTPVVLGINHMYAVEPDGPQWIDEFPDGFSISLGPPGGAIPLLYEDILKAAGVWNQVDATPFDHSEAASAYRSDELDAANTAIVSMGFNPATMEVFSTEDVRMVSLQEETVDSLTGEKPYFAKQALNEDHPLLPDEYEGMHSEIYATLIPEQLVFRPGLDEDLVYHFMKETIGKADRLQEIETAWWTYGFGETEVEGDTVEKTGLEAITDVPFHPGAAEYLQEIDEWNDEWAIADG